MRMGGPTNCGSREHYAREWVRLAITENHRARNRACIAAN
jgi:hypothetical protein